MTISFTVFKDGYHQVIEAVSGPFALEEGSIISPETSFCAHTVLRRDADMLVGPFP